MQKGDYCNINSTLTISAGGTASQNDLRLNDNGGYTVESISINGTIAGDVQPDVLGTIQITNKGDGKALFTDKVFIPNIASFGKNGKSLPAPRVVRASDTLAVEITNLAASAQTFYVTLHCKRA